MHLYIRVEESTIDSVHTYAFVKTEFFFLIEIYFYLRSNKVCLILFDLSLIKKLFVARML